MKRLPVICVLLALALPGAASARTGAPGDGTLLAKNANARIVVQAKGGLIGRCDECVVTIKDPNPDDGSGPVVNGAEARHDVNDTTTRWSGTNMRFRIIGGRFTVSVSGFGVDLSVIGKGQFTVQGNKGTDDDGTFSLNGAAAQPITDIAQFFQLSPTG